MRNAEKWVRETMERKKQQVLPEEEISHQ